MRRLVLAARSGLGQLKQGQPALEVRSRQAVRFRRVALEYRKPQARLPVLEAQEAPLDQEYRKLQGRLLNLARLDRLSAPEARLDREYWKRRDFPAGLELLSGRVPPVAQSRRSRLCRLEVQLGRELSVTQEPICHFVGQNCRVRRVERQK